MKIAIDAREAFSDRRAGKGQWTKGFLDELQSRSIDLTVFEGSSFRPGIRWHLDAIKASVDFDVYISPTSYIVPAFSRICIPIVHDLIAFQGEPHNRKAKLIEKLLLRRAMRNARHICTVSESTKADLLDRYPDLDPHRITTIYAGPMQSRATASKPDGKTILCVGTLCPRKNQLRLIHAYASLPEPLRSEYRLVLAGGRGWQDGKIVQATKSVKGVEWKDYVSDEEYENLLSTATVFAYPSLYEGFGMQVLDALQRGIPVLTSDRGSLKEVAADAAVVVDPENERSIASGLTAILSDADVRAKLSTSGLIQASSFSWKKTVDLFLEALERSV